MSVHFTDFDRPVPTVPAYRSPVGIALLLAVQLVLFGIVTFVFWIVRGHLHASARNERLAKFGFALSNGGFESSAGIYFLRELTIAELDEAIRVINEEVPPEMRRNLNLAFRNMGDAAVRKFAAIKEIECIDLYYTDVSDKCINSLIRFPALKSVRISGSRITPRGLKALEEAGIYFDKPVAERPSVPQTSIGLLDDAHTRRLEESLKRWNLQAENPSRLDARPRPASPNVELSPPAVSNAIESRLIGKS